MRLLWRIIRCVNYSPSQYFRTPPCTVKSNEPGHPRKVSTHDVRTYQKQVILVHFSEHLVSNLLKQLKCTITNSPDNWILGFESIVRYLKSEFKREHLPWEWSARKRPVPRWNLCRCSSASAGWRQGAHGWDWSWRRCCPTRSAWYRVPPSPAGESVAEAVAAQPLNILAERLTITNFYSSSWKGFR